MSLLLPAILAQSAIGEQMPVLSAKLPPCRICGGKASGLHYGINTCSACKGFFGRCIAHNSVSTLKCKNNWNCVVKHNKRSCPACRLQKCLQIGMSRQGIKIGRSPYMKVTEAIEEVKKLEIQLRISEAGTLVSGTDHLAQIDDVIQRLTDVHFSYMPHSANFYADVVERETLYLQNKDIEQQLFGEKRVLSRDEYNEFYKQTQIDIDGRKAVVKRLIPFMETAMNHYYMFARTIPGFKTMSVNDQHKLITAGYMTSSAFLDHPQYNVDHGLFVYPQDTSIVLCMKEILGYSETPDVNDYEAMMNIVRRTQRLDLTHEESVVAAALALMLAEADLSPIGYKIASASAEHLAESFVHLISKNHDADEHTYAKYITLLGDMKGLMKDNAQFASNMLEDTADVGLPDFMKEMIAEGVVI